MPPKKAAAGPSKKNVEKKKDKVIEASSVLEWGFLFFLFFGNVRGYRALHSFSSINVHSFISPATSELCEGE